MNHWFRTVFLIFSLLVGPVVQGVCEAGDLSYLFRGHFAPTDRISNDFANYVTPNEVLDREFSILISWPSSPDDYTDDRQKGNSQYGSYWTELVSIDIDVGGIDLTAPPWTGVWQTYNDSFLDYNRGIPHKWGDELRLDRRIVWNSEYVDEHRLPGGEIRIETFSRETQYTLSLRATDQTGAVFADDSLQTDFNFASFDDIRFEFIADVPVAGSDPRPIHFRHWTGVVDSVVAVPEPTALWLACLGSLGFAMVCRFRRA